MLAAVLNSPIAIDASIQVVRAFVRLRAMVAVHAELAQKLDALESKFDHQFRIVFDAIRQLMAPPSKSGHRRASDSGALMAGHRCSRTEVTRSTENAASQRVFL